MDTAAAREMWLDRARRLPGPAAVHPDTRWLRYDTWTRGMLQTWTLAQLRALLPGGRARRAVDLGCGFGDWTALFGELSDEIHACDLAPPLAAAARRRVAWHPAARIEATDIRAFALPRAVDFVYVGAVLMYLSDADALDVLARARDVAAPGALIVVREFCAFNTGRTTDLGHVIYRRPEDVSSLASRAGLSVVDLRCSPSIYGEVMGGKLLGWPLRVAWRAATAHWQRASHTFLLRADR